MFFILTLSLFSIFQSALHSKVRISFIFQLSSITSSIAEQTHIFIPIFYPPVLYANVFVVKEMHGKYCTFFCPSFPFYNFLSIGITSTPIAKQYRIWRDEWAMMKGLHPLKTADLYHKNDMHLLYSKWRETVCAPKTHACPPHYRFLFSFQKFSTLSIDILTLWTN